ncbi:MAG: DUF4082 domain-containing protein [Propionibacteriaceae bacterium]|nr:DUF4082 domain-containing protein [Propionibacteriaceae bacterium]
MPVVLAVAVGLIGGALTGLTAPPVASAATTTTSQLFSSAEQPRKNAVSSKRSANLGVRFRSSEDGTITALAFYRGPRQKKAYKGSLWSSKGKLLARTTFPKSSSVGWQTAQLSEPVAITANTTYVASYLARGGRYPLTKGRFSSVYHHDGLRVLKKGGLRKTSKRNRFPTHQTTSSYLVDVRFTPSAVIAPPDPDLTAAEALKAVAGARVFFGHQSVGGNIISGLTADFADAGIAAPPILSSRTAASGTDPVFQHTSIGTNGDPVGKMQDFARLLNGGIGAHIDVALMKLCYVDFSTSSDPRVIFDRYNSTMSALEAAYPAVTFLYTTAPVMTEYGASAVAPASIGRLTIDGAAKSDNVARERYNALIRAKYASSGRLFDIAALEAQRDDGRVMAGNDNGTYYYVMNPELTTDGGHLNDKGSRQLALALARLIAQNGR